MRTVTKENLIVQIDRLHKIKDEQGQLSMNGEYTLQVYEMLLATMEAEPVAWIAQNKNTGEVEIDEPFAKATNPKYWTDAFPVYRHAQPAPVVSEEMTPEMMRAVQLNSELGAYAVSNLSGAYDLFAEFWKVACRAAMLNQK